VTDARGNVTTLTYTWGHVDSIDTPNLDSTFVVTPEGLVTSATQGGVTTTYDYDIGLRLSTVHPPGTNPITYQPDDLHGAYVRGRGGGAAPTNFAAASGRGVRTKTSQGPTMAYVGDTCGRVVTVSQPSTVTPPAGNTATAYDALGRVKQVTDPAGKTTTF